MNDRSSLEGLRCAAAVHRCGSFVDPDGNPVVMRYRAYWRDDCPMAQLIEEITRSLGAE